MLYIIDNQEAFYFFLCMLGGITILTVLLWVGYQLTEKEEEE